MKKTLFLFAFLSLIFTNTYGQDHEEKEPLNGIGFCLGWGAPYGGVGVEYSRLITHHLDINLGAGLSFSGVRTGIGSRYFFKDGSSPFVGFNYVHTSGFSSLEVSINDNTGEFKVFSDNAVFLRGGYSLEAGGVRFMFNGGYGIPFDKKDAEHQGGDYTSSLQDLANLMALGGVEISGTIIIRFGK